MKEPHFGAWHHLCIAPKMIGCALAEFAGMLEGILAITGLESMGSPQVETNINDIIIIIYIYNKIIKIYMNKQKGVRQKINFFLFFIMCFFKDCWTF